MYGSEDGVSQGTDKKYKKERKALAMMEYVDKANA